MNRADLQKLARTRLREAKALLDAGEWAGAYYLAGYVVECGLKACIAKKVRRSHFPDRRAVNQAHTHDLVQLVKAAGLVVDQENAFAADPDLELNWALVKDWSSEKRYDLPAETDAKELVSAIADQQHGVLRWLRQHW